MNNITNKYNNIIALEKTSQKHKNGQYLYKCLCKCNKIFYTTKYNIINRKSCGCLRTSASNLIGQKFDYLIVLSLCKTRKRKNNGHQKIWYCQCTNCGKYVYRTTHSLRSLKSKVKSCGCYRPNKLAPGQSSFNKLVLGYKRSAATRGYKWELTITQAQKLFKGNCYYCGIQPQQIYKSSDYNGVFIYNGIDRLDNSKGYIPTNCVSCCWKCNNAKQQLTFIEFITHIKRIYHHIKDKNYG